MVYDDQDNRGENAIMQLVMIDNNQHFTTGWGEIVPGQNDTFAPVVPRVPGQISRCPCGVGAYGYRYCHASSQNTCNAMV